MVRGQCGVEGGASVLDAAAGKRALCGKRDLVGR